MTLANAHKITTLEIQELKSLTGVTFIGLDALGRELARGSGSDPKHALKALVNANWRRVCEEVFRLQRYHCVQCARLKPLEGHHRVFRSHGCLDTPENVHGLCLDCHRAEHGQKRFT